MYALVDRVTHNFIHGRSQYPMLFYDRRRANAELVRLRRAHINATIEVTEVRLVEERTENNCGAGHPEK